VPAAVTNLEVNRPDVSVFVADVSTTELSRAINMISFRASDVVLGQSDLEPELDEVFDALVQRMFELLGQRPICSVLRTSNGATKSSRAPKMSRREFG
jgi:hypothetical protein